MTIHAGRPRLGHARGASRRMARPCSQLAGARAGEALSGTADGVGEMGVALLVLFGFCSRVAACAASRDQPWVAPTVAPSLTVVRIITSGIFICEILLPKGTILFSYLRARSIFSSSSSLR